MDSGVRLRAGFPLPGRADGARGDALARFGPVEVNQVRLTGTCSLAGLSLVASSLVGPARGVVGTATYELSALPDRAALEAELGPARVQVYGGRGLPHEVAEAWAWSLGEEVGLTLSRYGAPRGEAVAGLFLSCGDARLARPFLPELTAMAPWRTPGRCEDLGVTGLEPCGLSDERLVLSRPGQRRPGPPWRSTASWCWPLATRTASTPSPSGWAPSPA
jgi:hypothetical protein